jgi:hypothetical protein
MVAWPILYHSNFPAAIIASAAGKQAVSINFMDAGTDKHYYLVPKKLISCFFNKKIIT